MNSIKASEADIKATATDVRPDFCIVGHSKSGTTALHDMLTQHPQLFMCQPKEPNFFATDLTRASDAAAFTRMSADEYRGLFRLAADSQLCGESSASNIYSLNAAREMENWNSRMKLIVMFREPVDFLVSYHQQMLKNPIADGESNRSLITVLALEADRKRGLCIPRGQRVPELLYYRERIRYAQQLRRVYEHFPRSQVLTLIYDDFRQDNAEVLQEVCQFLSVADTFKFELAERNPSVTLKSKYLQTMLADLSHGRGPWGLLKQPIKAIAPGDAPRRALRWAMSRLAFGPKSTLSSSIRNELRDSFRVEVESLGEMLNRDLVSEWGYAK